MTAPIVYVNATEIVIPAEEYMDRPQHGVDQALVRDIYLKAGMLGDGAGTLWQRESERDARTGLKSTPKEARGLFYGEELRDVRGYTLDDLNRRDRLRPEDATCNCSNPFCQV